MDLVEFLNTSFGIDGEMHYVFGGEKDDATANQDTYMIQYAQMARFLSNPEEVKTVAARLSETMEHLYTRLKSWYAMKGAFSQALKIFGPMVGFSSDVVILNGQAPGSTFSEVVFNKKLFRDVYTRPHGEFTHAIQWLLMAMRFGKEFDVPKLYKYSVLYKSSVKFEPSKGDAPTLMWNFLVDCFEGGGEDYRKNIVCNTYRCPQYTTNNLYTLSTYSWLGNFLLARRKKGLKGGMPNKDGGHYGSGREVTMPSTFVNRTLGGQPVYEQLNNDESLLRKALHEKMAASCRTGRRTPAPTPTMTWTCSTETDSRRRSVAAEGDSHERRRPPQPQSFLRPPPLPLLRRQRTRARRALVVDGRLAARRRARRRARASRTSRPKRPRATKTSGSTSSRPSPSRAASSTSTTAASRPRPRIVTEALVRYIWQQEDATAYTMWQILEPQSETIRTGLAELFGCDREEIAITRNASESLETLLFGFDLKPRRRDPHDHAGLPAHAHHAAAARAARRHRPQARQDSRRRRKTLREITAAFEARHHAAHAPHPRLAHDQPDGADHARPRRLRDGARARHRDDR